MCLRLTIRPAARDVSEWSEDCARLDFHQAEVAVGLIEEEIVFVVLAQSDLLAGNSEPADLLGSDAIVIALGVAARGTALDHDTGNTSEDPWGVIPCDQLIVSAKTVTGCIEDSRYQTRRGPVAINNDSARARVWVLLHVASSFANLLLLVTEKDERVLHIAAHLQSIDRQCTCRFGGIQPGLSRDHRRVSGIVANQFARDFYYFDLADGGDRSAMHVLTDTDISDIAFCTH